MKYSATFRVFLGLAISFFAMSRLLAAENIDCQTKKYRIHIESNGSVTYRSWARNAPKAANPDIQLSGEVKLVGTAPCTHNEYYFRNGNYTYELLGSTPCSEKADPDNAVGDLIVKNGTKVIYDDYCLK